MSAQSITTLYNFDGGGNGGNPMSGLFLLGKSLYGTASKNPGTVFKVDTNGINFFAFYDFGSYGKTDGSNVYAGVVLSGNNLYGTSYSGGLGGGGSVFAVQTNGSGFFTALLNFTNPIFGSPPYTNSYGANPYGGLLLSGKMLYGTTYSGGIYGYGTVFKVDTNGLNYVKLYDFSGGSDGGNPTAGLILSGPTLYGTTFKGNRYGYGSVFGIDTNGANYYTIHTFSATSGISKVNNDGANPYGGLVLSNNILYGTTYNGGISGNGTVFAVNIDTTGFRVLHNFTFANSYGDHGAGELNNDGVGPVAGLILSGNSLYGTTVYGGRLGNGTVFSVNTNGTTFSTLYTFSAGGYNKNNLNTNNDGANPYGGLVLTNNILYGTTYNGGISGYGTIFSLSLTPPSIKIIHSKTNAILTWPTYTVGVKLRFTTNLASGVWQTNSLAPIINTNGDYAVTNLLSGKQVYYRLSQ